MQNSVKDKLIARLSQACLDIEVGEAYKFSTYLNPVIAPEEKSRLIKSAKLCHEEVEKFGGRVWVDRSQEDLPGYCVGPVLVELPFDRALDKDSLAQQEHFGPILHIIGYDQASDAIRLFNSSEFGLTGGLFSQSQDEIDYFLAHMQAGNLYVNRPCTGARVAIEPFGGFKLSGTGPKAGSRNYLRSFHLNSNEIKTSVWSEEGEKSEYQYDLASPWVGSTKLRLKKISRTLIHLLHQYTSLFGGVGENEKASLRNFKNFIEVELVDYQNGRHFNRKIPGQLSYNDHHQIKGLGIYLAYAETPSLETIFYTFSALARGCGVTVLAQNDKAYLLWMAIADLFYREDFPRAHFHVNRPSQKLLESSLKNENLHFVINDGDWQHIEKVNKILLPEDSFLEQHMVAHYTALDAPAISDIKYYMDCFTQIRSFAVNTMRHGAPLDLNI